jgi:hypothetical protein
MAYRSYGSTHPKVTSPYPRDTYRLTDGINGNEFSQILKVVSKSPFFEEANKG